MTDGSPPLFPEVPDGYERGAVERFVDAAERERRALEEALESARCERAALEHELARVRDELDATKAATRDADELQARVDELEGDYAARVRALEALLASAAREIVERRPEAEPPSSAGGGPAPIVRGSWAPEAGPHEGR